MFVLLPLLLSLSCADRSQLGVDTPRAKVSFVGKPIVTKAEPGIHIIKYSFGGRELIYVPNKEKYDPAILDSLKAEDERNPNRKPCSIYRFGYYVFRGLVKNTGDRVAEKVKVVIKFRGTLVDSAYVYGDVIIDPANRETSLAAIYPNRTAVYEVYSTGEFIDYRQLFWVETGEEVIVDSTAKIYNITGS